MPSHLLVVMHPPSTVFEIIEKEFNRFLWSGVDGTKRQHWASWDNLSFPYTEGEANFRKLMDICKAYSAKQWWRFRTQDSLWSQFLKAKYSPRSHPVTVKWRSGQSHNWKSMANIKEKVEMAIFWNICSGNVSFWYDQWTSLGPLYKLLPTGTVPNRSVIRDAFNGQNWYWNACGDVPDNIKDHILHMNLKFYDEEDKPCWMKTNSGSFSTGSAWNFLRSPRREVSFMSKLWNKIAQPETLNHIFLDGPLAAAVWNHFGYQFGIPSHFNSLQLSLDTWWNSRPSNPVIVFLFKICPIIITWTVFWKRPAINFLKINSDGSHKVGSSGGGGVIIDSQGNMIMAYSIPFDEVSSNVAEAKALLFGIQWSIQNGINSLELETDSMILAAWVKDIFKIPWQVDATIKEIKRALIGTS
ncbi:uncharacterized protein LOC132639201 [Lycium barbarum]|uniref:uncharacterized protein LOC132639201 n=1 Tax=Lycium barbarum TaxID=112863 RepID=UPI00293EE14B|nr:uncharacterized protein LOC132639201 [Lycium barbarum]